MPRQSNCSFCGNPVEPGTGLMYVLNDGTILWFCSRKCFKSYRVGRDPRRLKWTKKYKQQTR
ncbi:MAG: 50S ribosomal protein L24e [Desulfurococcaceae archaeon]